MGSTPGVATSRMTCRSRIAALWAMLACTTAGGCCSSQSARIQQWLCTEVPYGADRTSATNVLRHHGFDVTDKGPDVIAGHKDLGSCPRGLAMPVPHSVDILLSLDESGHVID